MRVERIRLERIESGVSSPSGTVAHGRNFVIEPKRSEIIVSATAHKHISDISRTAAMLIQTHTPTMRVHRRRPIVEVSGQILAAFTGHFNMTSLVVFVTEQPDSPAGAAGYQDTQYGHEQSEQN